MAILFIGWYIVACCTVGACSSTKNNCGGVGWVFGAFILTPVLAALVIIVARLSEDN